MYTLQDLTVEQTDLAEQAAELLVVGFREHWPDSWQTIEEAREEVVECLAPDRIARAAIDGQGRLAGWIGALYAGYFGRVWELHPVVVRPNLQGQGIGRLLVEDLEQRVRERDGVILILGTDDVDDMTSLAGVDLWNDSLYEKIRTIEDRRGHPFGFYRRLGYHIYGVLPDANGDGKPDIYMAKKLR